jgi:cytoskeletal protein CcmA (bactofilin family)
MWKRERSSAPARDQASETELDPGASSALELDKELEAWRGVPEPPRTEPPAQRAPEPPAPKRPARQASVLGPTLVFRGELTADEDLVVQGRVEGSILHTRSLSIGPDGRMVGDIRARRVVIDGEVEGDVYALECVDVRATGRVRGNIFAPRVALAEGASFNGRIDMENAPAVPKASVSAEDDIAAELTADEVTELLDG